jgi:hypothetical protein
MFRAIYYIHNIFFVARVHHNIPENYGSPSVARLSYEHKLTSSVHL